ncbi:MAG: site-specific DNA-methyltransferase [Tepidisphaeraceae bacterium]
MELLYMPSQKPPDSDRVPLTSPDIPAERLAALQSVVPEAFAEGKLDLERLAAALGDVAEPQRERYGLSWAGKADAIRAIQSRSIGTLKPDRSRSINFDTTGNLFIEGDNLEVLKLLQRSYHGRVKMIYIDPPYNTGKEFIYPDNYAEGLRDYLEFSKQVGEGGLRMGSNADTNGRYHSKWLSMMYPRLFLARQLLCDDGVIFISIDDHEVHNLRMVINEIFGEENFVATIIWQKVFAPKNTARQFSEDHDYIIAFAKRTESWMPALLPRSAQAIARYENPDNDARGPWSSSDFTARNYYAEGQYEVTSPNGNKYRPPLGAYWRVNEKKFKSLDLDKRIWWGPNGGGMPRLKRFLSEVKEGVVPQTLWKYDEVGHTQEAKKELLDFVSFENTDNVIDSVKPTRLIQRMLQIGTLPDEGDIVLDFFAGTGTTAHALLKQNHEDGGNRQFILVQLPEPLPVAESKLKTILDVGQARIRSAIQRFTKKNGETLNGASEAPPDLGFKVMRLDASDFKVWDAEQAGERSRNPQTLMEYMEGHVHNILSGAKDEDILFELMLKSGVDLSASRETVSLGGKTIYRVDGGAMIVCLTDGVTAGTMREIIALSPKQVICLDRCFNGDDALKTNTVLEMKSHNIQFQTA